MSPNVRAPLLTGVAIISDLGWGWLGGADGGDGSTDVTNVTSVCVPRGVVRGLESGKTCNNIANISETPFLSGGKNIFVLRNTNIL